MNFEILYHTFVVPCCEHYLAMLGHLKALFTDGLELPVWAIVVIVVGGLICAGAASYSAYRVDELLSGAVV